MNLHNLSGLANFGLTQGRALPYSFDMRERSGSHVNKAFELEELLDFGNFSALKWVGFFNQSIFVDKSAR